VKRHRFASPRSTDRRDRAPGRLASRLTLTALAAVLAAMALVATASAAAPTLRGSFDGSGSLAVPISPWRLAVDESNGHVYVIDNANQAVDVFSATGAYLSQISSSSVPGGEFGFGGDDDVAVDNSGGPNDGNVYVNSENSTHVFAFDASGAFLWQRADTDPCGVGVDSAGNPWLDDFNGGLQKLDPADGTPVGSSILGGNRTCHFAFDASDDIVLNFWNAAVNRYDQAGNLLAEIVPSPPGAEDVAVDETGGEIYSVPGYFAEIHDGSGTSLGSFGSGTFANARGIAVNGNTGRIYIGDPNAFGGSAGGVVPRVWIYSSTALAALSASVHGPGAVSADAGSISACTEAGGSQCEGEYAGGSTVTLSAQADPHNHLVGWGTSPCVANPTPAECEIEVGSSDLVAEAEFAPTMDALTLTTSGSGSGTVTCDGSTCAAAYLDGTEVALAATPAPGSSFAGWSGGGCSGTGACKVALAADTAVTATFSANPVNGGGSGSGGSAGGGGGPADNSAAYGQCVAKSAKALKAAKKSAAKKHGKAKAKAIKAAKKRQQKALAACKAQFT
jgi:hypothetical protein